MQTCENKKILFVDYCNYEDYPIGGHLSWAKNMLSAFGNELSLVGITTDLREPVGKWFRKSLNGVEYDFFALKRYNKYKTKHILPDRLVSFFLLRLYRKRILLINLQNVFIQRHEILPAVMNFGFSNICYRFPGLESPLSISKYWFGKYLSKSFDKMFFNCLREVKIILASGDEEAIMDMITRSNGAISENSVIKFPTRIDTDIFRPVDMLSARKLLNLPQNTIIVVTTGRLAQLKGWKFMIDCFTLFQKKYKQSMMYFVGGGEDFNSIKEYILINGLNDIVILTGEKSREEISLYLNSADLFIMGSYKEGWSTSLSEAVACGVPSCVTAFSSAKEIIDEGKTGFVIEERKEDIFVQAMINSFHLPRPVDNEKIRLYSTGMLKKDLLRYWKLI